MMYHFLQRHSILRFALCFFLACLCCFGFVARPLVIAHAFAITASLILAAGSLLAAVGITFSTNAELQKGAATFYNSCKSGAADVGNFIEEQAAKMTAGTAAVMTVPTALFIQARTHSATVFPKDAQSIEDTSGLVGIDDAWRSDVGKTIREINSAYDYTGYPYAVTLNRFAPYSPNSATSTVSLLGSQIVSENGRYSSFSPSIGGNNVLRFKGVSGKTYDYKIYAVQTATGVIVEMAENGVYICGGNASFDGYFEKIVIRPIFTWVFDRELYLQVQVNVFYTSLSEVSSSKGFIISLHPATDTSGGFHISKDCTFLA